MRLFKASSSARAVVVVSLIHAAVGLQVGLTAMTNQNTRPSNFKLKLLQGLSKRDPDPTTLANEGSDTLYLAPITLDGTTYNVQIDTGSSDLWVIDETPGSSSNAFKSTSGDPITVNITYGTGWAAGDVESASSMTFSGVALQSIPYISASTYSNLVTSFSGSGILGLGFESMSIVRSGLGSQAKATLTWIQSYFNANSSEEPYITVKLSRAVDQNGQSGVLTLSEVVAEHNNITSMPKISTYPQQNPSRWNVLVDGIYDHNGQSVSFTSNSLSSSPDGKTSANGNMVSLLDTGATAVWLPADVINALYKSVPGATFNTANNLWYAPCGTRIYFTVKIGGQYIPIDPDDVLSTGSVGGMCSAIWRQQFLGAGFGFDALLGGAFLKSTYALFNFGNQVSPFVQLLPLTTETNPKMASYFQTTTQSTSSGTSSGIDSTASPTSAADLASTASGKKHSAIVGAVAVILILAIAAIIFFAYYVRRDKSKLKIESVDRSKKTPTKSIWGRIHNFMFQDRLLLPSTDSSVRSMTPDSTGKQGLPMWERERMTRPKHAHNYSEPSVLLYNAAKPNSRPRPTSVQQVASSPYPERLPAGYKMQGPVSGRMSAPQNAKEPKQGDRAIIPESPVPIGKIRADGRMSYIMPDTPLPISKFKRISAPVLGAKDALSTPLTKAVPASSDIPQVDIVAATPTTAMRSSLLSPDMMPSRMRLTPVAPATPDSSRRSNQRLSVPDPKSPTFERSAMPSANRVRHSYLYIPTGRGSSPSSSEGRQSGSNSPHQRTRSDQTSSRPSPNTLAVPNSRSPSASPRSREFRP